MEGKILESFALIGHMQSASLHELEELEKVLYESHSRLNSSRLYEFRNIFFHSQKIIRLSKIAADAIAKLPQLHDERHKESFQENAIKFFNELQVCVIFVIFLSQCFCFFFPKKIAFASTTTFPHAVHSFIQVIKSSLLVQHASLTQARFDCPMAHIALERTQQDLCAETASRTKLT
jgi:hypothetical protein